MARKQSRRKETQTTAAKKIAARNQRMILPMDNLRSHTDPSIRAFRTILRALDRSIPMRLDARIHTRPNGFRLQHPSLGHGSPLIHAHPCQSYRLAALLARASANLAAEPLGLALGSLLDGALGPFAWAFSASERSASHLTSALRARSPRCLAAEVW